MLARVSFAMLAMFLVVCVGCSSSNSDVGKADSSNSDWEVEDKSMMDLVEEGLGQTPTDEEDPEVLKKFEEKGWRLYNDFLISNGDPIVSLSFNGELTDEDLELISQSKTISFLNLMTANPSDEGVKKLAQLKTLERILIGGEDVTDEGVKALVACPKLNSVIIMLTKKVTDDGVAALAEVDTLHTLWISHVPITGECFAKYEEHPTLRELKLEGMGDFTDEAAISISKIPNLETLKLDVSSWLSSGEGLTRKGVAAIVNGNMPKHFDAPDALIDDELFLTMLDKGWVPPSADDPPENPEDLSVLVLKRYSITDKGLNAALDRFKRLRSIHLEGLDTSGDALARLKEQTQLRYLNANKMKVSGQALDALADLPIEHLQIEGTELAEEHFKAISKMDQVQELWLSNSKFDPAWLEHIQALPALTDLGLRSAAFNDEAAEYVSKMPNLEEIVLHYTDLTDVGFEKLLKAPKLRSVILTGTKVTPEAVEAAKAKYPDKSIYN